MELFRSNMSAGLLPKDFQDIKTELLGYDAAPQIGCAYEYTGQMSGPSPSPAGLSSPAAKSLYDGYSGYYKSVMTGEHPWPPTPAPICIPADQNGGVHYTLLSADRSLCAPAPNSTMSHVRYIGKTCGKNGSDIIWNKMATCDPRPGFPQGCMWSREDSPADIPTYFGRGCGIVPSLVDLPMKVCEPQSNVSAPAAQTAIPKRMEDYAPSLLPLRGTFLDILH